MKKKIAKITFISTISTILLYLIIVTAVDISLMGWPTPKFSGTPKISTYIISDSIRIDNQTEFRCSAFSSSFVIRQLGGEACGDSIYKLIPNKMEDGYVYPKGIKNYLTSQGYKVEYCIGNLNALKEAVTEKKA